MIPAAPLQIPGLGSGTLLIGGIVFAVVLVAILAVVFIWVDPWGGEPWAEFAEATREIVDDEDADAIAFIPYSDGPLIPKPAIYDRELLGGKGGYRTPDGERIYVDGQGNGKYSLEGVDVILAIDPTEHAAAVDPLKAYIAHENDLGNWIKVDREGNLIEAGEALKSVDDETPAMDIPKAEAREAAADGGYPSEVHRVALEEGMELEEAKAELEQAGLLQKIVDVAPPREAIIGDDGEVAIEKAHHVAVDLSAAANLLPKKTNTTAWQTMEEKARQEGMDEDKMRENLLYGIAIGAAVAGITSVVIALVLGFT
ncbi:MAG: hypothetical protein ACOCQY_02915 [Halorhabdus sp.]